MTEAREDQLVLTDETLNTHFAEAYRALRANISFSSIDRPVKTILVTSAVWTHARPAAAMLAAYEADPSLASMRFDFTTTLRETLEVLITGLLARPSR